ncbi:hypothetical protein CHUAL_008534 [Chamberlinius hualienensis]
MEMDDGNPQYHVRGSLDQIVLFKLKLEKMMTMAEQLKAVHIANLGSPNLHSVVQQIANVNESAVIETNITEPTEIMSRSKRKVRKPRKVSHDVYIAQTTTEEEENRSEGHKNDIEMEVSPNFSSDHSEVSDSPVLDDMIDIKPENYMEMHLEEVAEKKAEEWLSIPNLAIDADDLNDRKPMGDSNASTIYSCVLCSFKADKEGQFLKHVLSHSKDFNMYKCRKCDFASVSLNHYNRHQLCHNEAIFNCPECDFTSDDNKALSRHLTVKHTKTENPLKRSSVLQCNNCNYSTTKIYHFERHLLVHNRELKGLLQVHQCEHCPYKTDRKEHIQRHRHNVHTRIRPYSCNSCHRSYKTMESMQQHFKEAHSPVPQQ